MGDHAEDDDDVGNGGGVNSASISIARRFGSALSSFATRVAAILHILDRGGADAGAGAGAAVGAVVGSGGVAFGGGGVVVDSSGVVFGGGGVAVGSGGSRVSGRGMNRLHWVGAIVDSTAKPLLWWPGEGTKRLRRTGGSYIELATLWPTRLAIGSAAGAAGGRAVIVALVMAASESAAVVVVGGSMAVVWR